MENRAPVWLWVNLLSLDAPVVALVWQDFLARCYPSVLRPDGRAALGLTVWAIYLADRLLDVRHPASGVESARHAFYRRWRGLALSALALVLVADAAIALLWVRLTVLEHGVFVAAGIFVYMAAFPLGRRGGILWKKVIAGLLFTAGVFLVAATGVADASRVLLPPGLAFFALCVGNLLLVESWERGARHPSGSFWMAALAAACLGLATTGAGNPPWFLAVALSAAALALLTWRKDATSPAARGVLADVFLLSPLLFLPSLR